MFDLLSVRCSQSQIPRAPGGGFPLGPSGRGGFTLCRVLGDLGCGSDRCSGRRGQGNEDRRDHPLLRGRRHGAENKADRWVTVLMNELTDEY